MSPQDKSFKSLSAYENRCTRILGSSLTVSIAGSSSDAVEQDDEMLPCVRLLEYPVKAIYWDLLLTQGSEIQKHNIKKQIFPVLKGTDYDSKRGSHTTNLNKREDKMTPALEMTLEMWRVDDVK